MNTEESVTSSSWWRWPLVPIASIIGAMVGLLVTGGVLFGVMMWLLGFDERGWFFLYAVPAASGLVFGYLYIRIACQVAPANKRATGTIMATFLGLYCLLTVVLAFAIPAVGIQLPVATVSALAAAVATLATGSRESRVGA